MKAKGGTVMAACLMVAGALNGIAANADVDATEETERDPFWPVGYVPPPDVPVEVVEVARPTAWPQLRVRGRTRLGDDMMALIDGVGIVREGQVISRLHQGQWYHWRVNYIDQHIVRIRRIGVSREEHPGETWIKDREEENAYAEETL